MNPEFLLVSKMNLCKVVWNLNPNNIKNSESRILTNQRFESRIRWFWKLNPESAIHLKFESRIHNSFEIGIQNPRTPPPLTGPYNSNDFSKIWFYTSSNFSPDYYLYPNYHVRKRHYIASPKGTFVFCFVLLCPLFNNDIFQKHLMVCPQSACVMQKGPY